MMIVPAAGSRGRRVAIPKSPSLSSGVRAALEVTGLDEVETRELLCNTLGVQAQRS